MYNINVSAVHLAHKQLFIMDCVINTALTVFSINPK